MDDFGRAAVLSLAPAGDPVLKAQAAAYCEQIKASPEGWAICIQRFLALNDGVDVAKPEADLIRFFCLHVIEETVKNRFDTLTEQQRRQLREFLLAWLREPRNVQGLPAYLLNKVAHVLALIFKREYISGWHSFFSDLLTLLPNGPLMADLVLRVCSTIHEEVVAREINRTEAEARLSTAIKDTMRVQAVHILVDAWYSILTQYQVTSMEIVNSCLNVIGLYVSWIDVNLIVNDRFIPLLFQYLELPDVREEACRCTREIISKGMSPKDKVALIGNLHLLERISQLTMLADSDEEYLEELAGLVSMIGCTLIACVQKLGNDAASCKKASELLEGCVPLLYWFLNHDIDDISSTMSDFATQYIGHCKQLASSPPGLSALQQEHMQQMLQVITRKLRFDESYNHEKEGEDEVFFQEFRKDLLTMFNNLAIIDSKALLLHAQVAMRQLALTVQQNPQGLSYADVEVVLLLLYALYDAVPREELWESDTPSPLWAMLSDFVNSNIVNACPHKAVILLYYACVTRYDKFFERHEEYIPQVLAVFFSASGIRSSHLTIRGRACYFFFQFCSKLKHRLSKYIDQLLIQLRPLLSVAPGVAPPLPPDDQVWLFESVSVLIFSDALTSGQQLRMIESVLGPVLGYAEEILTKRLFVRDTERETTYTTYLAYATEVATRMARFVNSNSESATFFVQAFRLLVPVISIPVNQELLRKEVMKYAHRLMQSVGELVLPEIPPALAVFLQSGDQEVVMDSIDLVIQFMTTFKGRLKSYMNEMLMGILHSIFAIFNAPHDASDQEHARAMIDLKRKYFRFLQSLASTELVEVFVSDINLPHLPQILQTAIQVAKDPSDAPSQKQAVQILRTLVNKWMGGSDGSATLTLANGATFAQFATEQIVPASFEAVLAPGFDTEDAQAGLQVVNEVANLHIELYGKAQDEYIKFLLNACMPNYYVPKDAAQEFATQLSKANAGSFRKYFRRFVVGLRQSYQAQAAR